MVSEDDAAEVASPGPTADDNLVKAERDFLAKRVQTALDRARQALPPMDRLILKMRFEDRAAVSDIARALHLEQRPLYRTLERLLKTIGEAMQADGISRADIDALFNAPPIEWEKGRTAVLCRRQAQPAVRNERGPRGVGTDDSTAARARLSRRSARSSTAGSRTASAR